MSAVRDLTLPKAFPSYLLKILCIVLEKKDAIHAGKLSHGFPGYVF